MSAEAGGPGGPGGPWGPGKPGAPGRPAFPGMPGCPAGPGNPRGPGKPDGCGMPAVNNYVREDTTRKNNNENFISSGLSSGLLIISLKQPVRS